jgi:hypothetical protein
VEGSGRGDRGVGNGRVEGSGRGGAKKVMVIQPEPGSRAGHTVSSDEAFARKLQAEFDGTGTGSPGGANGKSSKQR